MSNLNKDIYKISKVKTPRELFSLIEEDIRILGNTSYLGIFVLDNNQIKYILKKEINRQKESPATLIDTELALENQIILHLLDTKKALLIKEINESLAVALTQERRNYLLSFYTAIEQSSF